MMTNSTSTDWCSGWTKKFIEHPLLRQPMEERAGERRRLLIEPWIPLCPFVPHGEREIAHHRVRVRVVHPAVGSVSSTWRIPELRPKFCSPGGEVKSGETIRGSKRDGYSGEHGSNEESDCDSWQRVGGRPGGRAGGRYGGVVRRQRGGRVCGDARRGRLRDDVGRGAGDVGAGPGRDAGWVSDHCGNALLSVTHPWRQSAGGGGSLIVITPGFGPWARRTWPPGFDRSDFSQWGGMSRWGEIFLIDQERTAGRLKRIYGEAQTHRARVLASVQVEPQTKRRSDQEKIRLNPLVLKREVARNLKPIASLCQAHSSNVNNSPPHTPPWAVRRRPQGGASWSSTARPPARFNSLLSPQPNNQEPKTTAVRFAHGETKVPNLFQDLTWCALVRPSTSLHLKGP